MHEPNPEDPGGTASELPQGDAVVALDPKDFTTTIDNPYWPMTPGTRWTYRELDADGTERTVVVTVTSETKTIANGIVARVVRDTVRSGDEIIEDTFDWYAQDADGSIWYLGEDTAEFENGEIVSTARLVRGRCRRRVAGDHHARPIRSPACSTGRSTTGAKPRTTARS